MSEMMYAVYSQQQCDDQGCYYIYQRPDTTEVLVTAVSSHPNCPDVRWPDKQDQGEVTTFVRTVITDREQWQRMQPKPL